MTGARVQLNLGNAHSVRSPGVAQREHVAQHREKVETGMSNCHVLSLRQVVDYFFAKTLLSGVASQYWYSWGVCSFRYGLFGLSQTALSKSVCVRSKCVPYWLERLYATRNPEMHERPKSCFFSPV